MAKVKLDQRKCKGCLLCIRFCPQGVFLAGSSLNDKGFKPVLVKKDSRCVGCGQCALICPECGIEITDEE